MPHQSMVDLMECDCVEHKDLWMTLSAELSEYLTEQSFFLSQRAFLISYH